MDSRTEQQPEPNPRGDCDIAIVGMACMFPKSPDLRRYWENIMRKLDCIEEVPAERWQTGEFFDEDRLARDKIYSKWGGFLDSMRFDPMKWKIPPASLLSIDPIQLMSLEVANQAFEDSGFHQREFPKERTGVIFACAGSHDVGSDYAFRTMLQHYLPRVTDLTPEMRAHITEEINATLPEWTEDSFPGFLMNVIAGRIANRFDLGGPNYVVDAACAASLAALHAAIGQLRLKTVDAMLVGAADGTNNPFCYMSFAKTHALSPRGRSRPFDNSADGIALGEGIGAIMIRRLADAERDGDRIYAVIKGIGASSDGRNRSMTAPHPPGQMLAMQRAYTDADVPAASVSLVEAHGTGTAVGDSTEITSLHTLFSEATSDQQYAAVGSVKSMIGHTKTCAGLASLIKTALALTHQVMPPTLHVKTPNENVDFRQSPFFINTESRPWFEELGDHPRRAGVSAFGFGGTNFHVVLEEYTPGATQRFQVDFTPRSAEICVWQRASRPEIVTALQEIGELLERCPTANLAQVTAAIAHQESLTASVEPRCRLSIVATSLADLQSKVRKAVEQLAAVSVLQDPTGIYYSEAAPVSPDRVAFLYPGQGSQAIHMLRDLAVVHGWGQEVFVGANRLLKDRLPKALTRYIYPPPAFSDEETERRQQELNSTEIAQPALGVVEVFATDLLSRFGIRPRATAGHSYGEYTALYAADAMSREDLLNLSALRGQVCAQASEICPGSMAAVPTNAAETQRIIDQHQLAVTLANMNGPRQTIIAGSPDAITAALKVFADCELRATRLNVTAAFHTASLASAVQPLSDGLKKVKFKTPSVPVYSNTLATQYPSKPGEIRKLLQRHLVEPVRFEDQVRQMRADGLEVFIEVGPGRVLSNLLGRIFEGKLPTVLTLDAGQRDGVVQFAQVLAQLSVLGLPCDLQAWYAGRESRTETLAEYVTRFQQELQPKRTEWILSVQGAKPVTPLPIRKGLPGDGLRAKFSGSRGATGTGGTVTQPASDSAKVPEVHLNGSAKLADETNQPKKVGAGEFAKNVTSIAGREIVIAPAPLPVARRFPLQNGNNGDHGTNGVHTADKSSVVAARDSSNTSTRNDTSGRAAASHSAQPTEKPLNGTHLPAQNGGQCGPMETSTNGTHAATATPQTGGQIIRRAVVEGQIAANAPLPMAPCMPLVTDWNNPQPNTVTSAGVARASAGVSTANTPNLNSQQILPTPTRLAVSMPHSQVPENGQPFPQANAQLVMQSQALMMQMLDLQKWQQQVALKFLDAHQLLLTGCVTGQIAGGVHDPALLMAAPAAMPAVTAQTPTIAPQPLAPQPVAAAPVPAAPVASVHVASAPVPQPVPSASATMSVAAAPAMAAPAPQIVTTRPAPVAVTPKVMAAATAVAPKPVMAPATVAVRPPSPVAAASNMTVAAPVAAPAVSNGAANPTAVARVQESAPANEGIPTPEAFKADLLIAVSERTGYPEDMLDLQLPMESGLGIDSIKTVEIFSNLKPYHAYFQQEDQDEEEALKEFTKLKTLGDIVSAYELRYQAMTSADSTPKLTQANGAEVERYTLNAVESPVRNGQKKTSHVSS